MIHRTGLQRDSASYLQDRYQLWPIGDYFDQKLSALPVMNDLYSGKPMAQGTLF